MDTITKRGPCTATWLLISLKRNPPCNHSPTAFSGENVPEKIVTDNANCLSRTFQNEHGNSRIRTKLRKMIWLKVPLNHLLRLVHGNDRVMRKSTKGKDEIRRYYSFEMILNIAWVLAGRAIQSSYLLTWARHRGARGLIPFQTAGIGD